MAESVAFTICANNKTCQAIFFAVIEAAVDCIDWRRHRSIVFAMNPES
jgi:hypothetical protein